MKPQLTTSTVQTKVVRGRFTKTMVTGTSEMVLLEILTQAIRILSIEERSKIHSCEMLVTPVETFRESRGLCMAPTLLSLIDKLFWIRFLKFRNEGVITYQNYGSRSFKLSLSRIALFLSNQRRPQTPKRRRFSTKMTLKLNLNTNFYCK